MDSTLWLHIKFHIQLIAQTDQKHEQSRISRNLGGLETYLLADIIMILGKTTLFLLTQNIL